MTDTPAQKAASPLTVRNFRLLWIGESISVLGDQFYMIALPWLVLQLTGSALAVGTILALAAVPRALFMLIGGALVDRFSPRVVMFVSNLVRLVLVTLLAILALTGGIQVWMLYDFALAFGLADAFFFPGQSAILPQILDEDQLQAGNTLTGGMAQLSVFLGPTLAGLLIARLGGDSSQNATLGMTGIGIALGLDALSFVASLIALGLMRVRKARKSNDEDTNVLSSIKTGLAYVWKQPTLRTLLILVIGINFLVVGPIEVGIPVLAARKLSEGAAAYGIIMSAFGGGALLGIILAGVLPKPKPAHFGGVMLGLISLLGIGLILMPLAATTAGVALIMLLTGAVDGYVNISFVTWLQKRVPHDLMGRVMSLVMFAAMGLVPVSAAISGAVLDVNLVTLFLVGGGAMTALTLAALVKVPALRAMGLEGEIGDIPEPKRTTGELIALQRTTTGEMPPAAL